MWYRRLTSVDNSCLKLLLISNRWDTNLLFTAINLKDQFHLLVVTTERPTAFFRYFAKIGKWLTAVRLLTLTRARWPSFFWPRPATLYPKLSDVIQIFDLEIENIGEHTSDVGVVFAVGDQSGPSLLQDLGLPLFGVRYGLPPHGVDPYSFKKTLRSRNFNDLYATICLLRSNGDVQSVLNGQHVTPGLFEPFFLFI